MYVLDIHEREREREFDIDTRTACVCVCVCVCVCFVIFLLHTRVCMCAYLWVDLKYRSTSAYNKKAHPAGRTMLADPKCINNPKP